MPVKPAQLARIAAKRAVHHETTIMGSKAHFWTYPAKGKSKGTIVVLHGYRGAHDGLEGIIGGLEDFDCIAPDLPGYGISEPLAARHSIETYSTWLGEFIKGLNLKSKPAVLGHSFATIVMSHRATQASDLGDLIMLNPVAKPGLKGPRRFASLITEGFFWLASKLPERGSRLMMDNWFLIQLLSSVMCKTDDKELRRWVHQQHHKTLKDYANSRVMFECYHASIHNCVEQFAADISNRSLLLAGAKDDITSAKQQIEVSKLFREHELVIIPKVGHLTHYETTETVVEETRRFLEGK